ncbi:UDP-4-amino-4,6-dideoxy-N-acetyl-beta-L-altrosamine transaminase [Hoeflea poritis]|uniref:UDP-4-amino-4, 6-dideoxy-N-acetyl-beta-L-altrosamine transaminase n=1 Tax=Hoeflea poritis TaxID=2993659 RepID=A0ABT4VVC9_9HYPH|nr:UDP-4-amino-4,6-dideoxy-N-acetyl-beta-L-altrosamine transaminase [Hoeflea poritis]MDA4848651.1 UDP-4-amino-4,6-dideoxy-N-acetyl-beta-L-altrosamine transaminase [Hoeflea poritis]
MIPYGRQDIRQDDIDAVADVLRSDFLTQGPAVPHFESAIAARVDAAHAVAVNSATSALHIACVALGLGPDDLLWTSPVTFVASANCARYCGAQVDFVDIDPATGNMCPSRLEEKLEQAASADRLPKIIIPVHLAGLSCDMAAIGALAARYGVRVIEDASHAVGASCGGGPVGSCEYSDIAVFSFHPVKIVTTGEGGVAVTQDAELASHMARLRSHGITRDPELMTHAPDGPWYYQQIELGWNYRMTDIQAALGHAQLARLEDYVARRNALADRYDRMLGGMPISRPGRTTASRSAFHLYIVRISAERHRAVFEGLRASGIGVNLHYIPVHLQPYYRDLGFSDGDFPEAERYYAEAISLPLFPAMTEAMQDEVVDALAGLLN